MFMYEYDIVIAIRSWLQLNTEVQLEDRNQFLLKVSYNKWEQWRN